MTTPWQRRAVFLGGAAALVGAFQAGPAAYRRWVTGLAFEPVAGVTGFRKLKGGEISSQLDPFVGLTTRDPGLTSCKSRHSVTSIARTAAC